MAKIAASHNPKTGGPTIVNSDGRVLTYAPYESLATLYYEGKLYAVASDFWEGALPTNKLLLISEA